jgi:hypothetical protein
MGISILKFTFLGKSIREYEEQFFYTFIRQKYQRSQDSNVNRINGVEIKNKYKKEWGRLRYREWNKWIKSKK